MKEDKTKFQNSPSNSLCHCYSLVCKTPRNPNQTSPHQHGRAKSGALWKEEGVQHFRSCWLLPVWQTTKLFLSSSAPSTKLSSSSPLTICPPVLGGPRPVSKLTSQVSPERKGHRKTHGSMWWSHRFWDESRQFCCFLSWFLWCLNNIFSFPSTN